MSLSHYKAEIILSFCLQTWYIKRNTGFDMYRPAFESLKNIYNLAIFHLWNGETAYLSQLFRNGMMHMKALWSCKLLFKCELLLFVHIQQLYFILPNNAKYQGTKGLSGLNYILVYLFLIWVRNYVFLCPPPQNLSRSTTLQGVTRAGTEREHVMGLNIFLILNIKFWTWVWIYKKLFGYRTWFEMLWEWWWETSIVK